jgi:hypothetical protein
MVVEDQDFAVLGDDCPKATAIVLEFVVGVSCRSLMLLVLGFGCSNQVFWGVSFVYTHAVW